MGSRQRSVLSSLRTRRAHRRWRFWWAPWIAGIVGLLGICLVLYPSVAGWVSQYNQSKVIVGGNHAAKAFSSAQRRAALLTARAYNTALNAEAEYQAGRNEPVSSAGEGLHTEYEKVLNEDSSGLMGRLQIPSIKLDLPIYHGTSDETLLKGIGHLEGTSLPVGGKSTHAVLTGHRGLASATMFTHLDRVKKGDEFTVSSFGRVLTYRVIDTRVVDPDETRSLLPQKGKDLITLVTCTPLGINTQRIFVTGQRVHPTPSDALQAARKAPTIPSFPWWALIFAGCAALIGIFLWRSGYAPHPTKHAKKRE